MLTVQRGAGDGIRVSCEVRNESDDVQQEFRPNDMWAVSPSCRDFEGHMQKHRKGGRGGGFAGIYLDYSPEEREQIVVSASKLHMGLVLAQESISDWIHIGLKINIIKIRRRTNKTNYFLVF